MSNNNEEDYHDQTGGSSSGRGDAGAGTPSPRQKCSRRGCASFTNIHKCAINNCGKFVCWSCVEVEVCQKNQLETLKDRSDQDVYVCTKKHYEKMAKTLAVEGEQDGGGGGRLPWNNDGPLGGDGSINSELILINWLCTEGNYARYRGKDNNGTRKKDFCEIIAKQMKEAGVRRERTAKQIQSKIEHIENSFRKAHDWTTTETGTGLQENDVGTFRQSVERICPFYYTLVDVFAERASAQPRIRSDSKNLDDSSTASTDDDEEDRGNNGGGDGDATSTSSRTRSSSVSPSTKRQRQEERRSTSTTPVSRRSRGGAGTAGAGVPNEIVRGSSSYSQSSKKQTKRKNPASYNQDNDLMERYSQSQMDNNLYKQATVKEMERHNKEIESIERKKHFWDSKQKEMDYKRSMHKEYLALKEIKMSDKRIAKIYPDMVQFFEQDDDEDDDSLFDHDDDDEP